MPFMTGEGIKFRYAQYLLYIFVNSCLLILCAAIYKYFKPFVPDGWTQYLL